VRAYLTTFNELGIETWLANSTLLGWWWGKRVGRTIVPIAAELKLTVA
jgi:hypothetical protein